MADIRLDGVVKRFGKVLAVDQLDLEISDGTFTAILGPSGCGKTTTMNMIAGLLRPTEGEIFFDGRPVTNVDPRRRHVGFVFQNYAIFTHMTVFDNLAFALRVRGTPDAEIDAEVQEVAALLGISETLKRRATSLSVNDLQKVALGRSMVAKPAIFLLDEPFSNLDAAFRAYMRAELKRLQRELHQTMVYVTHDQVEAMSMAEHIAVMNLGRLQQYGTPADVYDRPANQFVAGFIGATAMNFLRVRVRDTGKSYALTLHDGAPEIGMNGSVETLLRAHAAPEVTLGVRPEHLTLVAPTAHDSDLRGEVALVEPLGPRDLVHVDTHGERLRVTTSPKERPRLGSAVGLQFLRPRLHFFDLRSGDTLQMHEGGQE